ncbi:hypothetical protein RCE44_28785, partial [Klebsiella pneumoniae]|nr:hypothetical protein [Klebsiella pneumoniae]
PLTTDKYVGVQTSRDLAFDSTVATHFVPTMTVTGYVGTIYLKPPCGGFLTAPLLRRTLSRNRDENVYELLCQQQ